jgi:hypothetical protein
MYTAIQDGTSANRRPTTADPIGPLVADPILEFLTPFYSSILSTSNLWSNTVTWFSLWLNPTAHLWFLGDLRWKPIQITGLCASDRESSCYVQAIHAMCIPDSDVVSNHSGMPLHDLFEYLNPRKNNLSEMEKWSVKVAKIEFRR